MNLVLSLKNLLPAKPENEWLMEQYRLTQKTRFLEQLYDACADDLFHYMVTQSDPTLAQDICQKTWLKVIEKRNQYRPSGRFTGWLYSIARNQLIDEFRRQKRIVLKEELNEDPFCSEAHNTHFSDLHEALKSLPFFQREAIVLQQEGFGLQEIAKITNEDLETIKSRLRYARAKLKRIWSAEHE